MQVTVHLVSMPWSDPEIPSIQTGVLKAHLDRVHGSTVSTTTYSAFRTIVRRPYRDSDSDLHDELCEFQEYSYFLLCLERFLNPESGADRACLKKIMRRINESDDFDGEINRAKLECLAEQTDKYVDDFITPQLSSEGINLIGFTLNYSQLYSSLYCACRLRQACPGHRLLFIFGGAVVIYPSVVSVMQRFGLSGICIAGEGERKLEAVVRLCCSLPECSRDALVPQLCELDAGIFDFNDRDINLYELDQDMLRSQVGKIDSLAFPTFDEYFRTMSQLSPDRSRYFEQKKEVWIPYEGSRGCFAHCDFCDVHTNWVGFRKGTPNRITGDVIRLAQHHECDRVVFMDNVCDTWAEQYAEELIARKIRIRSFMELRVHHPETFWTKLALCGVEEVQVGIEALVQELLSIMNKGTRAKDNFLVLKWLRELGIKSNSNLISHHPKSTLKHVRQTKQILKRIPHFDRLSFSNFALLLGSPVDQELTKEERRTLEQRISVQVPKRIRPYLTEKGEYEPPEWMYQQEVMDSWSELEQWEQKFFKKRHDNPFMTVQRIDDVLLIDDGRTSRIQQFCLEGRNALIFDLCHQGPTLKKLVSETGFDPGEIQEITERLLDNGLLIAIGESLISLPLRTRDELIANLALADNKGIQKEETALATKVDAPTTAEELAEKHPFLPILE